jgi:hypothetical protein
MSEGPLLSRLRAFGIPRALLWTGVGVFAALLLLLYGTRAEAIQGQLADVPATIMVVVALVVGTALHTTEASRRLVDVVARPRSLILISVVAFVVLAVGSLLVFGTTPLSSDEKVHLFQARLFAQFKATGSYPAALVDQIIPPGYENSFILVAKDGRAMSVYWPGWALMMTPFVWLGAPWLLGPVVASAGLYVLGRLTSLLSSAKAAAVAVLLAVTSGSFIVTGMSLYPAGGHLSLNLLYAWLLLRGGRRDVLLAGLVGGLALNLNNPVPHATFALPWLIWLAVDRTRRGRLVWLAAGYAPWLIVFFGWFLAMSSLRVPAPGGTGGFWEGRFPLLVNLPTLDVLGLRFWELVRVWTWSAPGLLLLAALGWWRSSWRSAAWVLGVSFGVTVVLYALFPAGQGLGWGARYYQSAWGALPILAAILLIRPDKEALSRVAVVAALAGLVLVVPIQVVYAHSLAQADQAGPVSVQALSSPGVDLYFVNFAATEDTSITLWDDPSLSGPLVFRSKGPAADQQFVDRWFPGAQLVVSNSSGNGYARR